MKLLVVGDLHGQKPKIHFKDFDAIIAPGDFCSDALRKYHFQAISERMKNPNVKTKWYEIIGKKKAERMLDKSLRDGRKILEFLNSFGKPVFLVPGNWDQFGDKSESWKMERENNYKKLIKELENLKDLHFKRKTFGNIDFIGYGVVSGPEIPQYKDDKEILIKRELKKRKSEYGIKKKKLEKLFQKSKNKIIFMPHNVPFNTPLDKIENENSPKNGRHYGSVIAREIVDKFHPWLCIGGHMHEHFGKCKIGKTVCVNAGFGSKVNILIDLDEEKNKIKNIKFHPKIYG